MFCSLAAEFNLGIPQIFLKDLLLVLYLASFLKNADVLLCHPQFFLFGRQGLLVVSKLALVPVDFETDFLLHLLVLLFLHLEIKLCSLKVRYLFLLAIYFQLGNIYLFSELLNLLL